MNCVVIYEQSPRELLTDKGIQGLDLGPIEIESIPGPDYNAVARVMEEFNNETRACPCEPSCEEEVYPASVSSATWPSKKYMVIEIKQLALKAGVNF